MIHTAENFYSVEDYARLCGVSARNIRDRIKAGSIAFLKVDKHYAIDAAQSPPLKSINPHWRKNKKNIIRRIPFLLNDLREVYSFCRGQHFSDNIIYKAILTNKIDGYVLGDSVFVNRHEAIAYYKTL